MTTAHHTRKVIRVGRSIAVVIPPYVLEIMHAEVGDYLIWDTTAAPFATLSKCPIPPYITNPDKYSIQPETPI